MDFRQQCIGFRTGLLAVAVTVAGCVLPDYKTRKGEIPPPQPINLTGTERPLETLLHTVIVHRGPGAWKEETWWDEYVVSLTNHGDTPLNIESIRLVDFEDQASEPGDDPWKLERISQKWWQTNSARNAGYSLALGVGAYGAAEVAFWGGAAATGSLAGAATAGTVVLAAVPVTIIGTVMINNNQKHKIEAEFHRRRLVLPASVAPGSTATGSLFFRISPGPQRLVFAYRLEGQPHEFALELKVLAALHFKKRIYSSAPASQPSPAPTPPLNPPAPTPTPNPSPPDGK